MTDMNSNAHQTTRAFVERPALMLRADNVCKTFTLHGQGGIGIEALAGVSLESIKTRAVESKGLGYIGFLPPKDHPDSKIRRPR